MAGPLGKLTAVLGLDAREFQGGIKDAQKSLGGFGIDSAKVFKGIGLGAAAGFALATKGAVEAQEAQGKFMAATGATRDEAKKFVSQMDALAGSAGTVGMSFEDIAALGTKVEQQFGTTGDKTRELTENVAEFAKVTGSDATQAASDLEDTLSAYGLSADDATGFMDALVQSNQKFGTDVGPATLDTLRKMSAQLQATGGDIDDGIGFLNLFEQAGLDANAAATGLNTAIKTLKPGQTIDDLIAQVGGIEDPLERAQTAAKLFGKRAGPQLAEAIKPGMTSLDDFKVSGDDAGTHFHDAANGMLTDADKIAGIGAKIAAGAREIGQEFGPFVTAFASLGTLFGPAIVKGLSAGWGVVEPVIASLWARLAQSTLIARVIEALAAGAGSTYVTSLAKYLGPVAIVAAVAEAGPSFHLTTAQDTLNAAMAKSGESAGQAWASGIPPGLAEGIAAERGDALTQAAESFSGGVSSSGSWTDAGESAGGVLAQSVLEGWKTRIAGAIDTFNQSARGIGNNLADALRGTKDNVQSAMDDLMWVVNHPLKAEKEIARIEGALTSENLQKALNSKNPTIKTQAEQTQARLEELWTSLTGTAYTAGDDASKTLQDQLNDNYPGAVTDAKNFVGDINGAFEKLKTGYTIKVSAQTGFTIGQTKMPQYAEGAWSVPETGPAIIHRNEMVIPADTAARVRNGGLGGINIANINIYEASDARSTKEQLFDALDEWVGNANRGSHVKWSPA